MRLFVRHSFETSCSRCQIFRCHCYKRVLCRTRLWGVNTAAHWWWQAEIGVVWPGTVPTSMLQKEGEGGWAGHLLVLPYPAELLSWHQSPLSCCRGTDERPSAWHAQCLIPPISPCHIAEAMPCITTKRLAAAESAWRKVISFVSLPFSSPHISTYLCASCHELLTKSSLELDLCLAKTK